MRLRAGELGGERGEVELHVRGLRFRQDAGEKPALVDADGKRPATREDPLQSYQDLSWETAQVIVGRDRLGAFVHDAKLQVILQILADAGQMVDERDAVLLQQCGIPDSGKL